MSKPNPALNDAPAPALDWRLVLAILVGGVISALLVNTTHFLGHDWVAYFAEQPTPYFPHIPHTSYPPWVLSIVLRGVTILPPYTGLAIINGLTLSTVTVLSYAYGRRTFPESRFPAVLAVLLVLLSPLPWMLLWLGQIDMIVLVGLATLPVGIPILIGKLNVGLWAALNSRRDILVSAVWLAVSLLIWGFWPEKIAQQITPQTFTHPIVMGWQALHPLLLVFGGLLLLVTDRDPLRLMAAGSFMSPYMMPYHYFVLLPAVGRVRGGRQIMVWFSSFLMVGVAGVPTPAMKWAALLFPLLVWLLLAKTLRPRLVWQDEHTLFRRALHTARDLAPLGKAA